MPSTITRNGKAEVSVTATAPEKVEITEFSDEPKLWSEYRNPYMFRNCDLSPDVASAEGAIVETKKGEHVILNLDFLSFKYGRDITALGLADDKDGWLELAGNIWDVMQIQASREVDEQLREQAEQMHRIAPHKTVEQIYQQLKALMD